MSKDEEPEKKKEKKKEDELEEILELLEEIRKKLARIERGERSSRLLTSKIAPRLSLKQGLGQGLRQGDYRRGHDPKPEYKDKSEKVYSGKLSKEPEIYVPKERVVYDSELKGMLESVRKRLDEFLSQDKAESCEGKEEAVGTLDRMEKELLEQENEAKSEPTEEQALSEPNLEKEAAREKIVEPLPTIEENHVEEVKTLEEVEPAEAKDDFGFESKAAEPEEPRIELSLPSESEFSKLEPTLPEDLDDPVFWQNVENEIIEKQFKKPEVKPEPFDEYGY